MFRQSGAGTTIFTHIADAISAHYLLGFEPQAPERDGGQHKLAMRVSRPGVSVRVRPSFVIDDPTRAPPPELALDTQLKKMDIRRDLPLHAVAYTFRDTSDPALRRIVVAVEPGRSDDDPRGGGVRAHRRAGPRMPRGGPRTARHSLGHPVVTGRGGATRGLPATRGGHRQRPAGSEPWTTSSRPSSRKRPEVAMSALMTGHHRSGRIPSRAPSGTASDPEVTGYFEFYGQFPRGDRRCTVRVRDRGHAGRPCARVRPRQRVTTSVPTRFIATGEIPLRSIEAREVVLRALLSVNDRPWGE